MCCMNAKIQLIMTSYFFFFCLFIYVLFLPFSRTPGTYLRLVGIRKIIMSVEKVTFQVLDNTYKNAMIFHRKPKVQCHFKILSSKLN